MSRSIHVGKASGSDVQREAEECEKGCLAYFRIFGPVQKFPKTFGPHQNVLDIWSYLVPSKRSLRHWSHTKMS